MESNGSLPPGDGLIVTCGLTACTPGSAPGPTLGNEYGGTFTLPFLSLIATLHYLVILLFVIRPPFALYSNRTFPPTICWSVCLSICLSVCPVSCGKTAERIWMRFGTVGWIGPGMSQVGLLGFLDLSTVGSNFGANVRRLTVTNGEFAA